MVGVFSAFTLAHSLFEIPPDTDHVLLTSTEPAREGREEYLKRGNGNNHGGASLLH